MSVPTFLTAAFWFCFGIHYAEAKSRTSIGRDVIRPPIISAAKGRVASYILEFNARYGPGSSVGHLYTRTYAIYRNGGRKVTSLFGLYAAGGKTAYVESVFGTAGQVGYTKNDVAITPVERFKVRISARVHTRILAAASNSWRNSRWFQLFQFNCNALVRRVARIAGLRAPGNVAQFPDQYLRQMKAMNRGRGR